MKIIMRDKTVVEFDISKVMAAIQKSAEKILYQTIDFAEEFDNLFYMYSRKKAYSQYRLTVNKAINTSRYKEQHLCVNHSPKVPHKPLNNIFEQILIATCSGIIADIAVRLIMYGISLLLSVLLPLSQPENPRIACTVSQQCSDASYTIDFYENSNSYITLPDGSSISYAFGQ